MSARPCIGVFDSGVGGLTVLHELLAQVPNADYLYLGDTARLPYGSKSARTVAHYAVSSAQHLVTHGAEFLVIACNTATALALDEIKQAVAVPVIGVIEPGARAAAAASRTHRVAVIATAATIASHAYEQALTRLGMQSLEKACPLLVPLVEEGWIEHSITEQVARIYLDELRAQDTTHDFDVLVLGCTHYPLIAPLLRRLLPERVSIVDSAASTAAEVAERIPAAVRADASAPKSGLRFFTTDSVEKFRTLGARFLRHPISKVELVTLPE